LLWMLLIFSSSTRAGGPSNTQGLLQRVLTSLYPKEVATFSPEDWDHLNYIVRKIAHVTEYTVLTLLAVRAIQYGSPRLNRKALLGGFAISFLYACTDEFHQRFVPGRTPAFDDVLIDAIGMAVAAFGLLLWSGLKSLEQRLHDESE